MAKKDDHTAELWTRDGGHLTERVSAAEARRYDDLPFTEPDVTATRVTPDDE